MLMSAQQLYMLQLLFIVFYLSTSISSGKLMKEKEVKITRNISNDSKGGLCNKNMV